MSAAAVRAIRRKQVEEGRSAPDGAPCGNHGGEEDG